MTTTVLISADKYGQRRRKTSLKHIRKDKFHQLRRLENKKLIKPDIYQIENELELNIPETTIKRIVSNIYWGKPAYHITMLDLYKIPLGYRLFMNFVGYTDKHKDKFYTVKDKVYHYDSKRNTGLKFTDFEFELMREDVVIKKKRVIQSRIEEFKPSNRKVYFHTKLVDYTFEFNQSCTKDILWEHKLWNDKAKKTELNKAFKFEEEANRESDTTCTNCPEDFMQTNTQINSNKGMR